MTISLTPEIDRTSYEPAYAQLVNILQTSMATGVFKPGALLPSEAQLCEQYKISPMTVRRAINILLDRGLIITAKGRGTFVKGVDIGEAVFHLSELKEQIELTDRAQVQLLEARIVEATERVARKLEISPGDWTIYVRRLLLQDGIPVSYHRAYLIYDPRRPIVEGELEVTSLEGLIHGNGQTDLQSGCLNIEAVILKEEEAAVLSMGQGDPAFLINHTFYDFQDRPVSWGWFIWRADRLKFFATIGNRPPRNQQSALKDARRGMGENHE
jgi:DNA-binding GntR family transcriptional regulator